MTVQASKGILGRFDLMEDPHVADRIHPSVLDIVHFVRFLGRIPDRLIDIAVCEELFNNNRDDPFFSFAEPLLVLGICTQHARGRYEYTSESPRDP
jgi:hypothetical protein